MYATFVGFAVLLAILLLGCFSNFIQYGKDTDLWHSIFYDGLLLLFFIIFVVIIAYVIGMVVLQVISYLQ